VARKLCRGLLAAAIAAMTPSRAMADGPGLGNLAFAPEEIGTTLARFEAPTGAPFGHGFATMHKGYLVVPFAMDSGGGRDSGGFAFYDVSDPRAVRLTFTTAGNPAYAEDGPQDPGSLGEPHGYSFTRFGGRDYVCFTQNRFVANGSGLQVWDFTGMDTPAPVRISTIGLPGLNGGDYSPRAWWVFWQGGRYAYVAGTSAGLHVVDLTDPANPVLVASRTTSELGFGNNATNVVFAVGNLLVLTGSQPLTNDSPTGLATYDISDPANPVLLDYESALAGYSSMVNGNRIYGARSPAHVWSIENPAQITLVGAGPTIASKGGYGMVQDRCFIYGSSNCYVKLDTGAVPFEVVQTNAPLGFVDPDWDFAVPLGNLVFQGNDHSGSALVVQNAEPDTTGPVVNMVNPPPGKLNCALTTRVGLTFTDSIDLGTVNEHTVKVRAIGGSVVTGRYSHQTGIVNFWPDEPLQPDLTYEVYLPAGGVKDFAGNGLGTTHSSFFATGNTLETLTAQVATSGPVATGGTATFTARAEGSGTIAYSWDFGDGSEPTPFTTAPSASHLYTGPGHYAVTVRVTNEILNSAASLTQAVHRPPAPTPPSASATIAYDSIRDRVWCVNPDAGTVTAVGAIGLTKLLEVPTGEHPRTLAIAPAGAVWVVNQEDATVSVLDGDSGETLDTIALPHASRPYAIAFSPDGSAAWVSTEGTGDLLRLDPASGAITGFVRPGGPLRGIAISGDSSRIFVTRFISGDAQGEVHEIDPLTLAVVRTIPLALDPGPDTEASGRGLPNYLGGAAISPDGTHLWLPAKKDNISRGLSRDGLPLTFESTVRTILSRIDLTANAELPGTRVDFNDRDMANALAFTPLGDYVFVALQGSNAVEVLDAYTGERVGAVEDAGRAPQGLAVNPAGTRLFIRNFLDRSIAVHDTTLLAASISSGIPRLTVIPIVAHEPLPPAVLQGKRIFYDATDRRMNHDGYLSCASCHLDGGQDGRVWDFTDRGAGLRNTIDLQGRAGTAHGRVHWSANFDEIQDFEHDIRNAFGGAGFLTDEQFRAGSRQDPLGDPKSGLSPELDALAAYVTSLDRVHPSPHRKPDTALTDQALAGRKLFGNLGCYACHSGSSFTDSGSGLLHDGAGTVPGSGLDAGVDTPTLKGIWETAPYLHDGSAATLAGVLNEADPQGLHGAVRSLSASECEELLAYLMQIDGSEATYAFGPLASLTQPLPGALYAVGGTIPLALHAGDYLGAVSQVEFFHDGQSIAVDSVAPFEAAFENATAGEHGFHARVTMAGGQQSLTRVVRATALAHVPLPTVHVNFQPPEVFVPDGYLADTGEVFGDRGNGRSYGWNAPTTEPRYRNSTLPPDHRYATFNQMQAPVNPDASWELALPNGTYEVHLVAGDSTHTSGSIYRIIAENVMVVNASQTTDFRWREGTANVTVSDGRLTLTNGAGAVRNKICFIDVVPQALSAIATTVSLEAIAPATTEGSSAAGLVRLTRAGTAVDPLEVSLASGGTATPGPDYPPLPLSAVFPPGIDTLDLSVSALADDEAEGEESVLLSLMPGEGYLAGASSTATVAIHDKPFDAWRFATFRPLERIDGGVSGFDTPNPQSGIANGIAYALGVSPADLTESSLPKPVLSGDFLALEFTRQAGLPGISYHIEWSGAPGTPWTLLDDTTFTITPHQDGSETILAPSPFPLTDKDRQFLRLRVEQTSE
jgi:PKD repeat protein